MVYPLWCFSDGNRTVITRGSTLDRAHDRVTQTWPRMGVTIYEVKVLPINAAELYNRNHAPGWLYRSPVYEVLSSPPPVEASIAGAMATLRSRLFPSGPSVAKALNIEV